MPYYGPRFQPTARRSFWDELADVAAGGAQGYFAAQAVEQAAVDRAEAQRDREEDRRDRARRRGREDYEYGAIPRQEAAAPRSRAEYPATRIPSAIIDQTAPPSADRFPWEPEPGTTLQDLRPRQFPGADPYEAGGQWFDPEIAERRRAARLERDAALERDFARMERAAVAAEEKSARETLAREYEATGVSPEQARLRARGITPTKPDRWQPTTREEAEDWERFQSRLPARPTREPRETPVPRDRATQAVLGLYGRKITQRDDITGVATEQWELPEGADERWLSEAVEAFRAGEPIPPIPKPPPINIFELFGGQQRAPGWSVRGHGLRIPVNPSPGRMSGATDGGRLPGDSGSSSEKRVITQDQADYLKATGQWDPNLYQVR